MISSPATIKLNGNFILFTFFALAFAKPFAAFSQSNNQPVFNHNAICAKDLKKTADFYRTVLELKEITNPFHDAAHVWFKIGDGLALHVIQGDCPTIVHDISTHMCFSVPSLQTFMKHLDALQVKYGGWDGTPKKVELRPDGVHQIYFQDPDGVWIEVNDAK